MDKKIYNNDSFALRMSGFIVEENITQERVFEILENCYEPEFNDFEIEFWDITINPPHWIKVA